MSDATVAPAEPRPHQALQPAILKLSGAFDEAAAAADQTMPTVAAELRAIGDRVYHATSKLLRTDGISAAAEALTGAARRVQRLALRIEATPVDDANLARPAA
jgi:hypothetical protein